MLLAFWTWVKCLWLTDLSPAFYKYFYDAVTDNVELLDDV